MPASPHSLEPKYRLPVARPQYDNQNLLSEAEADALVAEIVKKHGHSQTLAFASLSA